MKTEWTSAHNNHDDPMVIVMERAALNMDS